MLQLCSAIVIFGWVWSIKYGLLFIHLSGRLEHSWTIFLFQHSKKLIFFKSNCIDKTQDIMTQEPDLPMYVRRHSSMDANVIYQAKPRLSGIALTKVKEEDT